MQVWNSFVTQNPKNFTTSSSNASNYSHTISGVPETAARKAPRQARSQSAVARILAAAEALYAREGVAACNTNRIAREAGLSIGSLYQYFPSKEAIFTELWSNQELDIATAIRSCPRANLTAWLEALIMVYIERKHFAHLQHPGTRIDDAIREALQAFQEDLPTGLGTDTASDMRAIIVALLQRESELLTGWQYTLTQRVRRTLAGYLAIR